MDSIIQSYLDYLLNVKLNNEIIENNNKKNFLESQVQNILKQNPDIISKSVYNQIGGDSLGKEDLDKIRRLNELFKEYTSHIKSGATALDINKVKDLLTSLKQKVSESSTTLNQLVLPQYMPQNLETVLSTISNNTSGTGFFEQMNQLYKIKIPSNSLDPDYTKYKNLLGLLQKTLDDYTTAQKNRTVFDEAQQKEILANIEAQRKEIQKNMKDIDTSIRIIKDTNFNIEKSFKKTTQINQKAFFDPNDPKETDINETERIYNQLISTDPLKASSVPSPSLNLLNENISNLLHDLKVEGQEFSIDKEDVSKIYDAQFVVDDKTGKISIESKYNKKERSDAIKRLTGGALTIEREVMEFTQEATIFKRKFDEYKVELSKYNFLQIRQIYHTVYSLMVLTNSIYNVSNYTIFKNVGRGTVNFYLRIINNIFDDLENPRKFKDPMVAEIRKKHYVTIVKLKYFLEDLNKKFTTSSKKLRISATDPYIKNMFTLLSHFRRFLEDYSIQGLSKVSIYARINYIKGRKTEIELNSNINDFADYQKYAMFFSDTERLTTNEGYDFQTLLRSDIPKLLDTNKNPEETAKLKKIDDMINKKTTLLDRDDRLMWVRRDTCNTKDKKTLEQLPPLRAINFTEVFDSTQYAHNEDISRYMNLASRLSTGSGICLITYGYSGTGKTYTLFGKVDEGKEIKGLLQSTLSQLNGLVGVHFRLFELYGYGFSHPDYWKNVDKTPRINDISHKVFEYKLKNFGSEGLGIDTIEEYSADQIHNFIDHIQKVRGHDLNREFENFYDNNTEKGHDADWLFQTSKTDDRITPIATPDSLKSQQPPQTPPAKLNYAFIDGKNVEEVFGKFSKFTNEVDKARKTGKSSDTTKEEDSIKRIRDTPNNIESSRSVLVYDFILGIKEEGKIKLVSFLIIDLPGREEIGKTFVSPFETSAIQDAIRFGYNKMLEKENTPTLGSTINPKTIDEIVKTIDTAIEKDTTETAKRWRKKINQAREPGQSGLKKIINDLKIVEIYDNMREIYGQGQVTSKSESIYNFDIKSAQTPGSYIYDLIQTEGNADTYIQEIRMLLLCMTLNPLCVPLFAHNILKQFVKDNQSEIAKIHNIPIRMSFKIQQKGKDTFTEEPRDFTIGDEPINSKGTTLSHFFTDDKSGKINFFDDPPQDKKGIGYSSVFKNRQIKIVYYIHLMNRLILLNRTDLIKKLYKLIIDHKINKLLEIQINAFTTAKEVQDFIKSLIEKNFKGQFLKEKLIEKDICTFNENNEATLKSEISDDLKKEIYSIVKYDYFINGFEGLYINENIMGLIKYLSDKRLTGKDNQNVDEQGEKLNFQTQQRIARLMLISKDVIPPQDENTQASHKYDKLIVEIFKLRKQFLKILEVKKDELNDFNRVEKLTVTERNNDKSFIMLKQNLLKGYESFIKTTNTDYQRTFNELVNDKEGVKNYYSTNISNINDESKLNLAKSELKQKSIEFIKDVKSKLDKQLEEIEKYNKERDYAMAVADLYNKLYAEFIKPSPRFENPNTAYYLIEYYKNISKKEGEIKNIAMIISNTIDGIGYDTKTIFTQSRGDLSITYNNINIKENPCSNITAKICTSDEWNSLPINTIRFNTLSNYSIGALFVYLQNYLHKYYISTKGLLNESILSTFSNKFSVLNEILPTTSDFNGTNDYKWDMALSISPTRAGGKRTFSYEDFNDYIKKVHAARTEAVKFLGQLQTELETIPQNISPDYNLCKIDLVDKYSKDLNAPLSQKITFSTPPTGPVDSDNVFTYKYKQVIKLVDETETKISARYTEDKAKEKDLLTSTIIELKSICNQMSNVIGLNINYGDNNNNVSIKPIDNIDGTNSLYNNYKYGEQEESELEKEILDATIQVSNMPQSTNQQTSTETIISDYITRGDNFYPLTDMKKRYTKQNINNNGTLKYNSVTDPVKFS